MDQFSCFHFFPLFFGLLLRFVDPAELLRPISGFIVPEIAAFAYGTLVLRTGSQGSRLSERIGLADSIVGDGSDA